jgi:hypothetical protein
MTVTTIYTSSNEVHYRNIAAQMLANKEALKLYYRIGVEEFLNHISTVFYVPDEDYNPMYLNGTKFEIEVGKDNPSLQQLMRLNDIRGLVGMTPQFPISNPSASLSDNARYIKAFELHLKRLSVSYVRAWGRARDFQNGGGGCFILIDVTPEDAPNIIYDQLSYTYLPNYGQARLISLVNK